MTGGDVTPAVALRQLARLRGVAVSYTDTWGERHVTPAQALVGVLAALGEPINRVQEAPGLLESKTAGMAANVPPIPPVLVAWGGRLPPLALVASGRRAPSATLTREDGDVQRLHVVQGARDAGEGAGTHVLHEPDPLPLGLHSLHLEGAAGPRRSLTVISPPHRLAPPEPPHSWGVFAPTYALHDRRGAGSGDLTALGKLCELVAGAGGRHVLTLPILAEAPLPAGTTGPERGPLPPPAPYSPLSRMWWSDRYLDLERLPELEGLLDPLDRGHATDPAYRRALLETAALRLQASNTSRRAAFRAFLRGNGELARFARFVALLEEVGPDRSRWRTSWRDGRIAASDVRADSVAAIAFAQWATDCQIAELASAARSGSARLMLDLPIGCQHDGYDAWAFAASYARGADIGAPPDTFFQDGQNWGLPPLHPDGEREAAYPVLRRALAHNLRHVSALRIDHVMGVRRLWWIPSGSPAAEGAYVHYPADEILGLAVLEAWRRGAMLVGEDLGTVEPRLRSALRTRGIAGMDVALFSLDAAPDEPVPVRGGSMALVDTHDTPTFAGWFDGTDLDDRERLGLQSAAEARRDRSRRRRARAALVSRLVAAHRLRRADRQRSLAVLAALLEELGESDAAVVVATLEDLWGEHDPQNIPGTSAQHANFRRPMSRSIEQISDDADLAAVLARLNKARGSTAPRNG